MVPMAVEEVEVSNLVYVPASPTIRNDHDLVFFPKMDGHGSNASGSWWTNEKNGTLHSRNPSDNSLKWHNTR